MGYQLLPKRKLNGVTDLNTARPSFVKNRKIKTTKNMEAKPQIRISLSIKNSLSFLIYL